MNAGLVSRTFRVGALSVLTLIIGCASSTEVPPQATSGLLEVRNGLIDGKAQIQKTTAAARDMINNPRQDVGAQINAFSDQVAQLDKDRVQARDKAQDVQARAQDYFSKWEEQLKTMSGSMAEAGQKRREESMASFGRMRDDMAGLRQRFAPFMNDLRESDRYLKTDPTTAGVKAATPTLRNALNQEPEVLRSIDQLIAQIDQVRGGK
ncbi:MAG: DUF2959 family protein [Tepidisphaeraceae bacterium]